MWKFLEGVEPPRKKFKTDNKKLAVKRKYDQQQRVRSFQPKWLSMFEWLAFNDDLSEKDAGGSNGADCDKNSNEDKKRMFCKVCKLYEDNGSFVTGSQVYKLESLKAHDGSESHKKNVKKIEAKNARAGTTVAEKTLETLSKASFDKLCKLFNTCHALAKNARPYTDYVWHCMLDEKKGLDIRGTYRNKLVIELLNSSFIIHFCCASNKATTLKSWTWEAINTSYGNRFANFLHLVDLVLCLPASSTDAERGFSQMKMTKSDWRSKLTDDHLSDLMMVALETPDIASFDPSPAIHLWNNAGVRGRRPNFMEGTSNEVEVDVGMSCMQVLQEDNDQLQEKLVSEL